SFGLRNPAPTRAKYGPVTPYHSTGLTDDAETRTSTWSSSGTGTSVSRSCSTEGVGRPYCSWTIAFMSFPPPLTLYAYSVSLTYGVSVSTDSMSHAQRRAPLTRDRVVSAAIALADESGIDAVSMRKLAKDLGVEAMSLYNHVSNKSDLVDAMVDRVVREIDLPSDPDWETAIRRCAISAYETFLRHPWACSLVMAPGKLRIEDNPQFRYMEWLLDRLAKAGFSPELTYRGYHALDSHILGFTMWHLGHSAGGEDITGGLAPKDFVA